MPQGDSQNQALQVLQQVFTLASQGRLSYTDLSSVAKTLADAKNYEMASYLYQTWIANTTSPMAYIVNADYGDVLLASNDLAGARAAFQRSLQLNGAFERARSALVKLTPAE